MQRLRATGPPGGGGGRSFPRRAERDEAAAGWAAVLSNLKSLLETGSPLPQEPWLVPQP